MRALFSRFLRTLQIFFGMLFGRARRPLPQRGRRAPAERRPSRARAEAPQSAAAQKSAPKKRGSTRASPHTDDAALVIDYAPRRDGTPDPGEVVWAWVPFEDEPSKGKDRPVLLIGRRGALLVGVALTSKPNPRYQVEIGVGPWDRQGRVSYAKIDRLIDLEPAQIRREGAVLERARFKRIVKAVELDA